jgi:hypothetical protein
MLIHNTRIRKRSRYAAIFNNTTPPPPEYPIPGLRSSREFLALVNRCRNRLSLRLVHKLRAVPEFRLWVKLLNVTLSTERGRVKLQSPGRPGSGAPRVIVKPFWRFSEVFFRRFGNIGRYGRLLASLNSSVVRGVLAPSVPGGALSASRIAGNKRKHRCHLFTTQNSQRRVPLVTSPRHATAATARCNSRRETHTHSP